MELAEVETLCHLPKKHTICKKVSGKVYENRQAEVVNSRRPLLRAFIFMFCQERSFGSNMLRGEKQERVDS